MLAYVVAPLMALCVGAVGYGVYAFSRYQGVIIPGVYVSNVNLAGLSPLEAEQAIQAQLGAINETPVKFVYGRRTWKPSMAALGVTADYIDTAANAYSMGRTHDFLQNLLDRLPLNRHFNISLIYAPHNPSVWSSWIVTNIADKLNRPATNAWVTISGNQAVVEQAAPGLHVNTDRALDELSSAMGSLFTRRVRVPVVVDQPYIKDQTAYRMANRVNAFLRNPPLFRIDGHTVKPDPSTLASYISFPARPAGQAATIPFEQPSEAGLEAYIESLVETYNVPVQAPLFTYNAGLVSVIRPERDGVQYSGSAAFRQFEKYFITLSSGHVIKVTSHVVHPQQDANSPATYGVTTLLGEGSTSLAGSPQQRVTEVNAIASQLNGILIPPSTTISFDQYVNRGVTGAGWPALDYNDASQLSATGTQVVGPGGAMQQVATTFFRAGYAAGLPIVERYPHKYRLPWYQPPGMDATVSPSEHDLVFRNTTGGYLLVQIRYEPFQQMLYIYVYGRRTGWTVSISRPKIVATTPPGAAVTEADPNLTRGHRKLIADAYIGYKYEVTRTVTTSGSSPQTLTETLKSDYLPRPVTYLVGTGGRPTLPPTPEPTPTPLPTPTASLPAQ